jgi:hypothetical protein
MALAPAHTSTTKPLVGCVHLAPSRGTPGFLGVAPSLAALDADLAALAGVDAILLENENDKPHTLLVNDDQVAWLTRAAVFARERTRVPLGINVQRIDWEATFAIAAAAELDFVRLDTLVDRVRMGGEQVALDAAAVMARRPAGVRVYVDIQVKHAELLDVVPLAESARRAAAAGADAILVTSDRTGEPPTVDDLRAAHVGPPVLIASGLDPDNAARIAPHADGAIVGTSLKAGPRVDRDRVVRMIDAWRAACGAPR